MTHQGKLLCASLPLSARTGFEHVIVPGRAYPVVSVCLDGFDVPVMDLYLESGAPVSAIKGFWIQTDPANPDAVRYCLPGFDRCAYAPGTSWRLHFKTWRDRESERLARGEYVPCIWHGQPWSRILGADHFAHCSKNNPDQIAYTESASKGARDRQTTAKPGRYLTRYFRNILSESQIRYWAEQQIRYSREAAARRGEETGLRFWTTPNGIVRAYATRKLGSCMYGMDCVRIYGAGDLAAATLERDGETVARAIVWPANKVYSRIYGDHVRMVAALHSEGYHEGSLSGARLLKEYDDDGHGGLIGPYIDYYEVDDDGDYLVLTDCGGDYSAESTDGFLEESGYPCGECGDRHHEDYMYWSEVHESSLCESCFADHVTTCDHCDCQMLRDDVITLPDESAYVCESCFADATGTCESCRDDFMRADMIEGPDGADHCAECYSENFAECDHCGAQCERAELTETESDGFVCGDCADELSDDDADDDVDDFESGSWAYTGV